MSDRVQEVFGLSARPFDKEIPPEQLWMEGGRKEALERLLSAVVHRQHALVTGEAGVGKTCVLRALQHHLSPAHYRVVYAAHVTLGRRDFYRQLCYAMGVEPRATAAAMFEALQREIGTSAQEQRLHAVLVLDEAHLMPDPTLGHLHVLANFCWDSRALLSLVLVGLPELQDRLRLGIHRSLLTRIGTRVNLEANPAERTMDYVRKRLKEAGARTEIFTQDGLSMLHEYSGGVLRSVDVLAEASLRLAAQEEKVLIDRALVRRARSMTAL